MNYIIKLSVAVSAALMLSGCGTVWVHNSKGESDFHSDKNSCTVESNRAHPVAQAQPAYSGSSTNCYGYGYSVNCTTTPTPNYGANIDWSAGARQNYYNSCMMGRGWREQQKETSSSNDGISSLFKDLF